MFTDYTVMTNKKEYLTCTRILSMMVILNYMSLAIVDMTSNATNTVNFNWSEKQKHDVLGSLFWGYFIGPIPGGRLAEIHGTRIVLGVSMFLTGVFTLLTPAASYLSYYCLIFVRFCVGLFVGAAFPAMFPIVQKWIAPKNVSKFMSHVLASQLGSALTLCLSGVLIDLWGWSSVFYVTGGITVIWSIFWFYLIYDSPQQHPRITQNEWNKLRKEISCEIVQVKKIPWFKMLTCLPVWAIIIGYTCVLFNANTGVNYIPLYLDRILNFNIKANGGLSSLPFVATYFMAVATCYFADRWRRLNTFSDFTIRTIFASLLFCGCSVVLLILSFWGINRTVAIVMIILWQGFCGNSSASLISNLIDIAPTYSGTITGIASSLGGLTGYLSTKIFTVFITNEQNFKQWQYIFWILTGANIAAFFIFCCCGSSELQKWNSDSVSTEMDEAEQIKINR